MLSKPSPGALIIRNVDGINFTVNASRDGQTYQACAVWEQPAFSTTITRVPWPWVVMWYTSVVGLIEKFKRERSEQEGWPE